MAALFFACFGDIGIVGALLMTGSTKVIETFSQALWLEAGLSNNTLSAYKSDLNQFDQWLKSKNLLAADQQDITGFLLYRQQQGNTSRSASRFLSSLRRFYGYWLRETKISTDPTLLIDSPRLGRSLPDSLSEADVELLLQTPNTIMPLGFRDRTMLEMLYATGLRVSELVALDFQQLNLRQGCIRIRGKGDKERLVPFGEEAADWLDQYINGARTTILGNRQSDYLFVTARGMKTGILAYYQTLRWTGRHCQSFIPTHPTSCLCHSFIESWR